MTLCVKVKAQKRQKEKGEAGGGVLSYYMAAAGQYTIVMYPLPLPTPTPLYNTKCHAITLQCTL